MRNAIAVMMAGVLMSCLAATAAQAGRGEEDVTTVRMTDEVVVPDTMRLGINTCGDNYWDSSIVKVRVAENFEGVMYRFVSWGPQQDENGIFVWFAPAEEAWEAMKGRVRWTLLGGPAKGMSGFINAVETKVCPADHQKRELCYISFDRPVPASDLSKNGVMLELENSNQGSIKESNNPDFWNAEQNTAHVGDVPPGSFGRSALLLRGSEDRAHYTFVPMWGSQADQNGRWRVQLWAKTHAGEPTLTVEVDGTENPVLQPTGEWRHHDLKLDVSGLDSREQHVTVRLVAAGGEVLVDDVVIWKEERHRNPTAFRDPMVDLLKRLKPGILRHLQMGGSNLENNLRPRLEQMGWTRRWSNLVKGARNSARTYAFNMHDYYGLCEHVGADPWYCVPGTLHVDEIPLLMEYLGAPADIGYGRVRAELGHPKPWTEVFDNIYIEFGNEAWNPGGYATGSYNGPEHWKDMIAAGKSSPHCTPNVVFVAGAQAGNGWLIGNIARQWVPNADVVAIAPYLMNGVRQQYVEHLTTGQALFRWVYGYTIKRVLEPGGRVSDSHAALQGTGKELAIYEHQFHLTNPRPGNEGAVPLETRRKMFTSIGGGLNVLNDSLLMMRECGVRRQCLFNLNQKNFFGIPLWGFVPGINVWDQRYRPLFLAEEIVNKVIGGDMVRTVHGGARPTFTARGVFEDSRREISTYEGIPVLWSYAFRDGRRRGLVLFNLDTEGARRVQLELSGQARGGRADAWWLTADRITASNEYDNPEPQVEISEEVVTDFEPGRVLELPPHSMVGLTWQAE